MSVAFSLVPDLDDQRSSSKSTYGESTCVTKGARTNSRVFHYAGERRISTRWMAGYLKQGWTRMRLHTGRVIKYLHCHRRSRRLIPELIVFHFIQRSLLLYGVDKHGVVGSACTPFFFFFFFMELAALQIAGFSFVFFFFPSPLLWFPPLPLFSFFFFFFSFLF